MTHKTIPSDKRRKAGVSDSLIRLSAGLEDTEDLLEDLRQALDKVKTAKPIVRAASPEIRTALPLGKVFSAR